MRAILPALVIVVASTISARSQEPHTFRGKTVEGWLAVFRDKESTDARRSEAAVMLGCFGPEARSAAPFLIDALRKDRSRGELIEALVSMGEGAELTGPILVDHFLKRGWLGVGPGMGTYYHGGSAIGALTHLKEQAVPALQKALDGPDANLRIHAAYALGEIGPAAREAVPSLIRALENADPNGNDEFLVDYSIRALGRMGPDARAAIRALNLLLDERKASWDQVVWALDRIGAPPVQRLLDTFLREADFYVADLLGWLGPRANGAVPALRAALTDKRPQARICAAVTLVQIDPSATDAIPVLIESLTHRDDEAFFVGGVPDALARLGPKAGTALPLLIRLVIEGSSQTEYLKAMVMIDPNGEACVPALIAALKHEDDDTALVAAHCLGALGPRARDAIPALTVVLTREHDAPFWPGRNPQVAAAKALRRIGPVAKSAIPAIIRTFESRHIGDVIQDYETAAAAAESIGSFGTEARSAIPALVEALRSRDKDADDRPIRRAAALALGRIRPEARAAIPVLRETLAVRERLPWHHAEAVIALYQLAPDGRQLAERWLEKPVETSQARALVLELEARAMVLGAMGRTSFESDWVTRRLLVGLDLELAQPTLLLAPEPLDYCESWFEEIGRLGVAGRLAIPRLKEMRNSPSPFVRMWAAEALGRITPPTK
jgi:HEAT repeat protein